MFVFILEKFDPFDSLTLIFGLNMPLYINVNEILVLLAPIECET